MGGGGYLNMANARFATVLGGSRNSAQGRYSLAGGYAAVSKADYAATINLLDDKTVCINENENSFMVCADSFVLNGLDYIDSLTSSRRLKEDEIDCKSSKFEAEEQRISAYESVVAALLKIHS